MNRRMVNAVIKRDGLTCQYCSRNVIKGSVARNGLVIEHVNGRSESIDNLCVACRSCNSRKNKRTAVEWSAMLVEEYASAREGMKTVARIEAMLERLK